MATPWGMTRGDVLEAHRAYLESLVSEAMADGRITAAEHRDLADVCDLLGLDRAVLTKLVQSASAPRPPAPDAAGRGGSLRGKTVCFTGEMLSQLKGERVTRELAEKLAGEAGLVVQATVTKRLDFLVVADPDTQSGKAKKARQYGVRIMAEVAFWRALGLPMELPASPVASVPAPAYHRPTHHVRGAPSPQGAPAWAGITFSSVRRSSRAGSPPLAIGLGSNSRLVASLALAISVLPATSKSSGARSKVETR